MEELENFFKFLEKHLKYDFKEIRNPSIYIDKTIYYKEGLFYFFDSNIVYSEYFDRKCNLITYINKNAEMELNILYDFSTGEQLNTSEQPLIEKLFFIYKREFSNFYKELLKHLFYNEVNLKSFINKITLRINSDKQDFNKSDYFIKSNTNESIPFTFMCLELLIKEINAIKNRKDIISNLNKEIFNNSQFYKDLSLENLNDNEGSLEQENKEHKHRSSTLQDYTRYYNYYQTLPSTSEDKIKETAENFGKSEKTILRAIKAQKQ